MTDAELAFKTGSIFNKKITSTFWSSFKGEYGKSQVEVLVFLSEVESAQPSEIVKKLNISKQHVSLILKEFIKEEYVKVKTNPDDKRSNLVSITKSGQEYIAKHIQISNDAFDKILSKMTKEEKEEFLDAMKTVYTLLSKI